MKPIHILMATKRYFLKLHPSYYTRSLEEDPTKTDAAIPGHDRGDVYRLRSRRDHVVDAKLLTHLCQRCLGFGFKKRKLLVPQKVPYSII